MARRFVQMYFLLMFVCLLTAGCDRAIVYDSEVVFKGFVYSGHRGQDGNGNSVIINDGPVSGATVTAIGRSPLTKSLSDGSYLLRVPAVRSFTAPNTDTYTLEAYTIAGLNEKITVSGKPGETINVRSFVLLSHAEEQ